MCFEKSKSKLPDFLHHSVVTGEERTHVPTGPRQAVLLAAPQRAVATSAAGVACSPCCL